MKHLETSVQFKKRCDIFRAMLERGPVTCRELQYALKTNNGKWKKCKVGSMYGICADWKIKGE